MTFCYIFQYLLVCFMVFNITFNNISVISWWSVLLVEVTEYPKKITNLSQVTDKLYHIMLYTSPWSRFELTTSVVIGIDCIGSCKSNYHTIKATTAPSVTLRVEQHVKGCLLWVCNINEENLLNVLKMYNAFNYRVFGDICMWQLIA